MKEAAIILLAYLVGSVPMTYILGRMIKHIDIRRYGSGNVGASNAWVHVGKWVVAPVAVFDLLVKGSLSVYLAQQLSGGPWLPVFAGLAAIAGHNWSVYLKFTGGRGITVVLGVLLVLALKELAAASLVVVAGWIVFRNSGLWVGIGVATLPIWSVVFGEAEHVTVLCVGLVVLLAIKRLVSNRDLPALGDGGWRIYLHRLLYDRDVSSRDDWVHRAPVEGQEDG